jgi:hypothetical protein
MTQLLLLATTTSTWKRRFLLVLPLVLLVRMRMELQQMLCHLALWMGLLV